MKMRNESLTEHVGCRLVLHIGVGLQMNGEFGMCNTMQLVLQPLQR